jgi:hypothetical protein
MGLDSKKINLINSNMTFDNLKLNLTFRNRNLIWNTEKFSLLIGETKSGMDELANIIARKFRDEKFEHEEASTFLVDADQISNSLPFERILLDSFADFDWKNIKNSLIIIKNIGSELDPNSIRELIEVIRNFVDDNDCIVIATTYSPIVLNQFRGNESSIFVLSDSKSEILPITEVLTLDYMRHFSIGDLYERNEFF